MGPKSEHSQTTDPAPSSGRVSPDDGQIRDKGAPGPGPHERKPWNHAVALRLNESDPSLCHRFGHPRLPSGSCFGSRRRSVSAPLPAGAPVLSSRGRARARPGAADPGGSCPVSPRTRPERQRPGGRGRHRARSGSAGPGPRRAPTGPGSPPAGRNPPRGAARRPPAPRAPAHN